MGGLTWPIEDRIRWVEQRLREWESVRRGSRSADPQFVGCLPVRKDLEVWLAKERDGLSWQQIAIKYLRQSGMAALSKTRRAHARVERAIAPSRKELQWGWLDGRIREVFGCTPEQF